MPSEEEILNSTSAWHKSDTYLSLFEWFGWTWREYQQWVEDPNQIPDRPLANGGNDGAQDPGA